MSRVPIPASQLPPLGGRALLRIGGRCLVLFHTPGGYRAIDDSCPHQGASLACGKLADNAVQCPAHGLRFDIATGAMRGAPGLSVPVYPVDVEEGTVSVTLPDA
jgi:3-phenylpropionate/trans-cinnamate dioxygenase ferredoxin subunit